MTANPLEVTEACLTFESIHAYACLLMAFGVLPVFLKHRRRCFASDTTTVDLDQECVSQELISLPSLSW